MLKNNSEFPQTSNSYKMKFEVYTPLKFHFVKGSLGQPSDFPFEESNGFIGPYLRRVTANGKGFEADNIPARRYLKKKNEKFHDFC